MATCEAPTAAAANNQQGGGGATGGVNSWADWKTKGCAILGVRTVSQKMAPNQYDCFDQNCRTGYFDKAASLQSYASHMERVHKHNVKELAAYLPIKGQGLAPNPMYKPCGAVGEVDIFLFVY